MTAGTLGWSQAHIRGGKERYRYLQPKQVQARDAFVQPCFKSEVRPGEYVLGQGGDFERVAPEILPVRLSCFIVAAFGQTSLIADRSG